MFVLVLKKNPMIAGAMVLVLASVGLYFALVMSEQGALSEGIGKLNKASETTDTVVKQFTGKGNLPKTKKAIGNVQEAGSKLKGYLGGIKQENNTLLNPWINEKMKGWDASTLSNRSSFDPWYKGIYRKKTVEDINEKFGGVSKVSKTPFYFPNPPAIKLGDNLVKELIKKINRDCVLQENMVRIFARAIKDATAIEEKFALGEGGASRPPEPVLEKFTKFNFAVPSEFQKDIEGGSGGISGGKPAPILKVLNQNIRKGKGKEYVDNLYYMLITLEFSGKLCLLDSFSKVLAEQKNMVARVLPNGLSIVAPTKKALVRYYIMKVTVKVFFQKEAAGQEGK